MYTSTTTDDDTGWNDSIRNWSVSEVSGLLEGDDPIIADQALEGSIDGWAGNYSVYEVDDTLLGGNGHDRMFGGAGNDSIRGGEGEDFVDGGNGHDFVDGGAGKDSIVGGEGEDTILGGDGNDSIYGEGDDLIYGGLGDDYIVPGVGSSTVSGGVGNDVYELTARRSGESLITITDFQVGKDHIKIADEQLILDEAADSIFSFRPVANGWVNHSRSKLKIENEKLSVFVTPAVVRYPHGGGSVRMDKGGRWMFFDEIANVPGVEDGWIGTPGSEGER
ncbi:MAG: hypothetical protein EBE86_006170 [Hormoscilla sp. GUM202]|nr:hypothetical protein [Hormoscilla sp. GUM202]